MAYNVSWIANSSGPLQLLQRVNSELMFNHFGHLALITIGVILLTTFILKTNNTNKSFAATSFICFGLCMLLRAMSLVSDWALFVTLILAAGSIVLIKK